jgi:hypothetical protein
MKAIDIIYQAKQSGVEIILNEDQLQLLLPENDEIDESLIQSIRDHKPSIIDFLKNSSGASRKNDNGNTPKIKPLDRKSSPYIPLSFSQERIWFIDQLEGSLQYHTPEVYRLKGTVNKEALRNAIQTIINRHEVLRTVVRQYEGRSFQFIKDQNGWQLHFVEGSKYKQDPDALQKYIDSLINAPFDLSNDDMIRVHHLELGEEDHVLLITMHHIASDGWSKSIFVNELN